MDVLSLRRWLAALEDPALSCPFCQKLSAGPGHAGCLTQWARLLSFAYPTWDCGPDRDYGGRVPGPPCTVISREARVNVLALRYDRGEDLWNSLDLVQMSDLGGLALEVSRLANGAVAEGEVLCG
jgi:hypothetical protein